MTDKNVTEKDNSDKDLSDDDIAAWELPVLEETFDANPSKTNVFNRQSTWKYEPPEVEEDVLPPTAQEIEQIRESAYQEGFEQGKKEGHQAGYNDGKELGLQEGKEQGLQEGKEQGLVEGKEQVESQIESWHGLMEQLHQPVSQVEEVLQSELVKLAVSLAKSVIRTEVQTNPEILFNALNEGLKALPIHESQYQIHMHPGDIELVKERYTPEQIEKNAWVFVENQNMSRGGCDISTQNNAVDASIERRVKDVLNKFLLEQGLSDIESES
ncbi:flagellar assembly protein FliH [Aliiglaciecola sp. 2_MG-2023]|uniref:flagellar assembly protein FliH n=1 Tax=unclassified Aliiglaciecola TaxID=2593648 RepID=UPI0026E1EDBB|nr:MULTISPECIES: flagellar assembly protein FliH [unclassified Aliiglaciecola]MDO6709386.1 flagellar assembly protein FliH [Aliiglaciecola sp. 2_MG-2023]MDO6750534.1 flagellar assembly protein FliH [Aliiglaciecola sp. 1_MG-2023]